MDAAIVCKHCGRDLVPDAAGAATAATATETKNKASQNQRVGLGCLIVFLAL
jgi:hypothetical protein